MNCDVSHLCLLYLVGTRLGKIQRSMHCNRELDLTKTSDTHLRSVFTSSSSSVHSIIFRSLQNIQLSPARRYNSCHLSFKAEQITMLRHYYIALIWVRGQVKQLLDVGRDEGVGVASTEEIG